MAITTESFRKSTVLTLIAAGLSVTAGLLYVLAWLAQQGLRFVTGGALRLGLGLLAWAILLYVFATFVGFGTRQRPDQPSFVVANVAVQGAFLTLGFLLFGAELSALKLVLALSLTTFLHAGSFGFALLRRREIRRLAQGRGALEAVLDRLFRPRSFLYLALPLGGLLGSTLGSLAAEHATSTLAQHAVAGALGAVALTALVQILSHCDMLVHDFVRAEDASSVGVHVDCSRSRYRLHVSAPAPSTANAALGLAAVSAATDLRRVFLLNQLEQLLIFAACSLLVWRLELLPLPAVTFFAGMLALLLSLLSGYLVGQLKTRARNAV